MSMRLSVRALSLPLCLMFLNGCGTPDPRAPVVLTTVREVPQTIPVGLLECAVEPLPPALRPDDVEIVANTVVDIIQAMRDCQAKLSEVKGLILK